MYVEWYIMRYAVDLEHRKLVKWTRISMNLTKHSLFIIYWFIRLTFAFSVLYFSILRERERNVSQIESFAPFAYIWASEYHNCICKGFTWNWRPCLDVFLKNFHFSIWSPLSYRKYRWKRVAPLRENWKWFINSTSSTHNTSKYLHISAVRTHHRPKLLWFWCSTSSHIHWDV